MKRKIKIIILFVLALIGAFISWLLFSNRRKALQQIPTGSSSYPTDGSLPRGLRNNNPLNIRVSNDNWQGLRVPQTDSSFFQFTSNEYGYRAAYRVLKTYKNSHNINSVQDVINRWAPASDGNNTSAYFNHVQDRMAADGFLIGTMFGLPLDDVQFSASLIKAMAISENGIGYATKIDKQEILNGIALA